MEWLWIGVGTVCVHLSDTYKLITKRGQSFGWRLRLELVYFYRPVDCRLVGVSPGVTGDRWRIIEHDSQLRLRDNGCRVHYVFVFSVPRCTESSFVPGKYYDWCGGKLFCGFGKRRVSLHPVAHVFRDHAHATLCPQSSGDTSVVVCRSRTSAFRAGNYLHQSRWCGWVSTF